MRWEATSTKFAFAIAAALAASFWSCVPTQAWPRLDCWSVRERLRAKDDCAGARHYVRSRSDERQQLNPKQPVHAVDIHSGPGDVTESDFVFNTANLPRPKRGFSERRARTLYPRLDWPRTSWSRCDQASAM
jgi:hypothetical protein